MASFLDDIEMKSEVRRMSSGGDRMLSKRCHSTNQKHATWNSQHRSASGTEEKVVKKQNASFWDMQWDLGELKPSVLVKLPICDKENQEVTGGEGFVGELRGP